MTLSDPAKPVQRALTSDVFSTVRYYLGSRTGLIAIAAAGLGLGAWFNWSWFVAAGIAPLIIGVAPCAAMCALGLCMSGRMKSSTDTPTHAQDASPGKSTTGISPSQLAIETDKGKGDCCGS